jgi:hypothetical protein
MLSINLSRFNGLLLALIISITSSISAITLADTGPSRAILNQANASAQIEGAPALAEPANVAIDEPSPDLVGESQPTLVGETWRRTELYFGASKSDGSTVTRQEFEDFVDEIVTPRFPDGLTLLAGDGQWRDSTGTIIEEESNVLILLYPLDDREANSEIEQIREAYKDAFQQESVLRVDDYSRVSF